MGEKHTGFDFIGIGEALIDFISTAMDASLASAKKFHAFVGGQPTNLAINLALMGKNTALAACVGRDGFGDSIVQFLDGNHVDTQYIQRTDEAPTSISIIARNSITPDFIINRGADADLQMTPGLEENITHSHIVHSSAFALARDPLRSTVLQGLQIANLNGCLVTFDPNYHPKTWPDNEQMIQYLHDVYRFVDVTKPSLDDCERIFAQHLPQEACADRFLDWGASVVLITKGSEGVYLATAEGDRYEIYPKNVDVADVTGAGDAFWAGYLAAVMDGRDHVEAARFGQVVAETKVGVMGPLSDLPNLEELMERARLVEVSQC
jgi:fructokinase